MTVERSAADRTNFTEKISRCARQQNRFLIFESKLGKVASEDSDGLSPTLFFKSVPHLQVGDFVDEVAAVVGAVGVVADEAIVDFDFESLLAMQLDSSLLLAVPLVVDVWVIGDG